MSGLFLGALLSVIAPTAMAAQDSAMENAAANVEAKIEDIAYRGSVSYTHLTLPTICSV